MENTQRYILEIYRQGSLSKAAGKLFITQPALSIALKKAEDRLGCRIFEKNTHPVKVTAVGKMSALALNSSEILKQRHLCTPPLSLDRIPAGIPYIAIEDRTDKVYGNWYDTSCFANRTLEVSSMTTAYRLAKQGLGACLVSDMLVRQGQRDDMLFFRTDINPFERQFCAVYSRNGYLSRAAGAFISMGKI